MKKTVLIISLLLIVLVSNAQRPKVKFLTTFDDKKLHFGFSLGISTLDFGIRNYASMGDNPAFQEKIWPNEPKQIVSDDKVWADMAKNIPGFTVGIISSLRISQDLELRFLPGLSFGERILTYNIPVIDNNFASDVNNYDYSIKSTFLDFPLLIKYKARRINNGRPYVIFGGAYRQDISRTAKEDLVRLRNGSFYAELGGGWDTYLLFFRFSVEAKVSIGLNNILGDGPDTTQRQYYTYALEKLTSNIFTLSFHFE